MKNLSIFITLFCIIISSFSPAQSQCRMVYINDFNGEDYSLKEKAASYNMENGYLYIEGLKKRKWVLNLYIMEVDETKDFEIEASITKVTTAKKNGYGIIFGYLDQKNYFTYSINDKGEFAFIKVMNGEIEKIIPLTESEYINTGVGSTNNLRIIKEGEELKFYSNGHHLATKPSQRFFGNMLGFNLQRKQKIAIDYLKVFYFTK